MYSFGDIKFNKPVSLKKIAYLIAFFILWTVPILLIFGIKLNVVFAAIALGPPFLLANYASKPIISGMTLIDWLKSVFSFLTQPAGWLDLVATKKLEETYKVENEIWISRRRELELLADIRAKRNKK
jgi:hypothetical protein